MPGIVVDGHDFFDVYEVAGEAVKRARTGGGPTLIECRVNRYYRHFEGDAQTYRAPNEVELSNAPVQGTYRAPNEVEKVRQKKDCLQNFSTRAVWAGLVREDDLVSIDREISDLIEDAVSLAKAAPKPDAEDLLTDVYASY